MLCLGMHDWELYFKNCFEHLEKGGWVEIQEVHMTTYSDASPPPPKDAPFLHLGHLVTNSLRKAGVDGSASYKFKSMLERVDFVDVKELLTRWPVGDWSNDENEKLIGRMQQKNLEIGLHGMSLSALTKHGGFTTEEAEKWLTRPRKTWQKIRQTSGITLQCESKFLPSQYNATKLCCATLKYA